MRKLILPAVITLAFLVRVIGISDHPAGFTPDEASFGYDAYSLLHTGRDQWGNSWPLVLKSFGDGKLPVYAYLTVPSIAIFGLNEFAVRFPNAIAGTLAVLVVYMLIKELRSRSLKIADKVAGFNWKLEITAAMLLSLSPWHIQLSRGAFEANLTTLFLPLALYFYLKAKQNNKFLIIAVIMAGVNVFTYHSARLVTPLLFGLLMLLDYKKFVKDKWFWLSACIAMLFIVLVFVSFTQGGGTRLASSSIFQLSSDQRYTAVQTGANDFVSRIFYNKVAFLSSTFLKNYLSYFSPQFLFTSGAAEATYGMIPGKAVMYLPEILLIVGFLIYLVKNNTSKFNWLILWILLAPVPAALTTGPGYAANRAEILLPALNMVAALGLLIYRKKVQILIVLLIAVSFTITAHSYLYIQPVAATKAMVYGARQIFDYTKNQNQYNQIFISKKISEPHIYTAFYEKIDPIEFQTWANKWGFEESGLHWVDQLPEYYLGNYIFKSFNWISDSQNYPNSLFVGEPGEFPEDAIALKKIYSPDNKEIYWIVGSKTQ